MNLYLKYVLAANAFCTGKLMTIATQITTRVVIIMVSSIVSNNLAVHSQFIETVHDPASGAARCELACSSPREAESLEPKWRGYNSILIASTPPPPDLRLQAFKPPNTIKGRRQGTKPHKSAALCLHSCWACWVRCTIASTSSVQLVTLVTSFNASDFSH